MKRLLATYRPAALVWMSVLTAPAPAATVYVSGGTPHHMKVESGNWSQVDGFYQSNNASATVSLGDILTTGDFHLRATLRHSDFSRNPGYMIINGLGEFGLSRSGGTSKAFVRGFFFGDITRDVADRRQFMPNDSDNFLVDIQRNGDLVTILINNKTFWTMPYEGDRTMGKIAFRSAANGGLRIKDVRLISGATAPVAQWVNPRTEVHEQPGEQTDVFSRGSGGYHTYRIPAIVRTRSGVLLAFCEGRKNGPGDSGKIDMLLKRSLDDGKTWEPHRVVHTVEGNITIGNPAPIYDRARNRTTLVFCHDNDRVFTTRSSDDGLTWSTPIEITDSAKQSGWTWYATGPGHGLLTTSGRMIIPANHGSKAHAIISDDFGSTWRIGGIMDGYGNEVSMAELSNSHILVNSRNSNNAWHRRQAISSTGGESWQPAQDRHDLIEPTCQGSVLSTTQSNGAHMLLFSNPASVRRERLTVRYSDNDGTTWSQGRVLYEGSAAYSDLVDLGDGWFGCLYERNWYDHLTFARFHISWLRESRIKDWMKEESLTRPHGHP